MLTVKDIKEKVNPIAKQYGLQRMYLFGSYAKNIANQDSDVDLIYERGTRLSLLKVSCMLQDLKDVLGCPVDLVSAYYIEPEFKNEVLSTMVLIYEK